MKGEGQDASEETHSTHHARARAHARERARKKETKIIITCVALCAGFRGSEPALPMIHAVGEPVERGRVFTLTWPFIAFYMRSTRANVERERECDNATRVIVHCTNETPQIALNASSTRARFTRRAPCTRLIRTAATTPDATTARGERAKQEGERLCAPPRRDLWT